MCSSIWHTDEGLELYCVGELPSPIHYSRECERYLLPTLVSSEVEERDEKMEKVSQRDRHMGRREAKFSCTSQNTFVLALSSVFSLSRVYLCDVNICVLVSVVVLVAINEAKVDMRLCTYLYL